MATVESHEVRARAVEEARRLGPTPTDPLRRAQWTEEERRTIARLIGVAAGDPVLLRRAALEPASKSIDPEARRLLLAAAEECSRPV